MLQKKRRVVSVLKCPKCNSIKINQFRMTAGAIWCGDCGYRVMEKEKGNPFIVKGNTRGNKCL